MLNFLEISESRVITRNIYNQVTFDTNRKYLTSAGKDVLGEAVTSFVPRGGIQTYTSTNNSWHSCMPATQCFSWEKVELCTGIVGFFTALWFRGIDGTLAILRAISFNFLPGPDDLYWTPGEGFGPFNTFYNWTSAQLGKLSFYIHRATYGLPLDLYNWTTTRYSSFGLDYTATLAPASIHYTPIPEKLKDKAEVHTNYNDLRFAINVPTIYTIAGDIPLPQNISEEVTALSFSPPPSTDIIGGCEDVLFIDQPLDISACYTRTYTTTTDIFPALYADKRETIEFYNYDAYVTCGTYSMFVIGGEIVPPENDEKYWGTNGLGHREGGAYAPFPAIGYEQNYEIGSNILASAMVVTPSKLVSVKNVYMRHYPRIICLGDGFPIPGGGTTSLISTSFGEPRYINNISLAATITGAEVGIDTNSTASFRSASISKHYILWSPNGEYWWLSLDNYNSSKFLDAVETVGSLEKFLFCEPDAFSVIATQTEKEFQAYYDTSLQPVIDSRNLDTDPVAKHFIGLEEEYFRIAFDSVVYKQATVDVQQQYYKESAAPIVRQLDYNTLGGWRKQYCELETLSSPVDIIGFMYNASFRVIDNNLPIVCKGDATTGMAGRSTVLFSDTASTSDTLEDVPVEATISTRLPGLGMIKVWNAAHQYDNPSMNEGKVTGINNTRGGVYGVGTVQSVIGPASKPLFTIPPDSLNYIRWNTIELGAANKFYWNPAFYVKPFKMYGIDKEWSIPGTDLIPEGWESFIIAQFGGHHTTGHMGLLEVNKDYDNLVAPIPDIMMQTFCLGQARPLISEYMISGAGILKAEQEISVKTKAEGWYRVCTIQYNIMASGMNEYKLNAVAAIFNNRDKKTEIDETGSYGASRGGTSFEKDTKYSTSSGLAVVGCEPGCVIEWNSEEYPDIPGQDGLYFAGELVIDNYVLDGHTMEIPGLNPGVFPLNFSAKSATNAPVNPWTDKWIRVEIGGDDCQKTGGIGYPNEDYHAQADAGTIPGDTLCTAMFGPLGEAKYASYNTYDNPAYASGFSGMTDGIFLGVREHPELRDHPDFVGFWYNTSGLTRGKHRLKLL